MATEDTTVIMINKDGQSEQKYLKKSDDLEKTIKLPSKKDWKLAKDDIVYSGEVFVGFFIHPDLDEPYGSIEDVVTITKQGYLLVYQEDSQGYLVNLHDVKSVTLAGIPFSERSGKWFELLYVGINLVFDYGKVIIIGEKYQGPEWIAALSQFLPCPIEEEDLKHEVDLSCEETLDDEEDETSEDDEEGEVSDVDETSQFSLLSTVSSCSK